MSGETSSVDRKPTRDRLLDVARQLIAQHGFESVSLRDISAAAGANVAAVNYHFGSKEKLFDEIQLQFMRPVSEERMRLLNEVSLNNEKPDIKLVLDAFLRPLVTMVGASKMSEQLFLKLMGRCMMDQQNTIPEPALLRVQQELVMFSAAFQKAAPHVDRETLLWRLHYSFGAMVHTLIHSDTLKKLSNGKCGEPDFETQLSRLIDFCAVGFIAEEKKEGKEV
ncbi:MAG: TetR/AcrR family transcriptional regulator [Akkermansiaceae bacterium]